MPGDIIMEYEYESMDKESIKLTIDKQKKELNDFIAKFNDLDKFIKDYKEEEIQIQKLKETMLGYQRKLGDIEKKIKELENKIKIAKNDID